ncbi:hypothetical protein B0H13DRAFT_2496864 [Mycena leptocephala]|nr:hypothetical protein B0H13DRAFT_2496864 [Mycena leptocephala]
MDPDTQSLLGPCSSTRQREQEYNTVIFCADWIWRRRRRWSARIGVPGTVQTVSGTAITIKDTAMAIKDTCTTCSKGFNRPNSLKIHANKHNGVQPFLCPFPGCGRAFNVNSNMQRHFRAHGPASGSKAHPPLSLTLPSPFTTAPVPVSRSPICPTHLVDGTARELGARPCAYVCAGYVATRSPLRGSRNTRIRMTHRTRARPGGIRMVTEGALRLGTGTELGLGWGGMGVGYAGAYSESDVRSER